MIYNHKSAIKKYKTHAGIIKAVENGKLIKLERNLYATSDDYTEFEYIVNKYPKVIFTMQSAFYYLGLCHEKPEKFHLATKRTAIRMKDKCVKQYYQFDKFFTVGVINMKVENINIHLYNKERMLIELIRSQGRIDDDLFTEIINNYKKSKDDLDYKKLISYIKKFNGKNNLIYRINKELELDLVI